MQVGFICPDGQTVTFDECINGGSLAGCRFGDRCYSLHLLRHIAEETALPDPLPGTDCVHRVSDLLKPTRQQWLIETTAWYEPPRKRFRAHLGTGLHLLLAQYGVEGDVIEVRRAHVLGKHTITGQPDALVVSENTLIDFKLRSSWKVKQMVGEVKRVGHLSVPLRANGEVGPSIVRDEVLQMNIYRYFLQQDGYDVDEMMLIVAAGDYNSRSAFGEPIFHFRVAKLPRDFLLRFFIERADRLDEAYERDWADICPEEEQWIRNGHRVRCNEWCPVRRACDTLEAIPV